MDTRVILLKPTFDFSVFDPRWQGAAIGEREWHFHRRLFERYGTVLAPGEFSKIVSKTKKRRYQVSPGRDGAVLCRIYVRSAHDFVLVAAKNGRLITALPPRRFIAATTVPTHSASQPI